MVVAIPESERAEFEDILGSGGIFRRVVRRVEGGTEGDDAAPIAAEFGEEVTVRYSEWLLDTDDSSDGGGAVIAEDQLRQFRIGDGEVMPALELAAKMMRVGDVNEIRCDPRFAYGDKGRPPLVPPDAPLRLLVELLRVGKKITAEMSSAELLEEATKKKESGNRYFKDGQFDQAAKLYKKALKILESWEQDDDDAAGGAQCRELLIALGNNVANVQHRLEQHKEARQSSLEVLQLDPKNLKAIYRLGQIALAQGDFDEATQFLKQGVKMDPQNAKFRQLLAEVKAKREAHRAREKQLYAKLGGDKSSGSNSHAADHSPRRTEALSPTRQFIRANIGTIGTVLTALIALLMYQFIGKKYHDLE